MTLRELAKISNRASARSEVQSHLFLELDREVKPLLELLGNEALLVPEVCGKKKPRLRGWNTLTHEAIADPSHYYYRALADAVLAGGNLGVLLGAPSGNLCAVDLDREEAIEPFLRKNPRLEETLRSTGSGVGAQFWVRIRGYYTPPGSQDLRYRASRLEVRRRPSESRDRHLRYRGVARGSEVHDLGRTRVGNRLPDSRPGETGRADAGRNFTPVRMAVAANPPDRIRTVGPGG